MDGLLIAHNDNHAADEESHITGMLRRLVFFCFESFIYNPLHAARRAMAAAGFSKLTFSCLEPARAVIVRLPSSPSPHKTLKK